MVILLETEEQKQKFTQDITTSNLVLCIPVYENTMNSNIICFYIKTYTNEYILNKEHPDIQCCGINISDFLSTMIVPQKKKILQFDKQLETCFFDASGIEQLEYGTITDDSVYYTNTQQHFYNKFHNYKNLNKVIPIMVLVEYLSEYGTALWKRIEPVYKKWIHNKWYLFYNTTIIPTLTKLEKHGLYINKQIFEQFYFVRLDGNYIFNNYNPYTSTGRPSNSSKGVNLAAINKTSGVRKAFTSRFKNGSLVLMDFESFHLRLIAKDANISLKFDSSVHEQLAKQYFKTDTISTEQYEKSKQKTFELLYSDYRTSDPIPIIKQIYNHIDVLWKIGTLNGYVTTPKGKQIYLRDISDVSSAKFFNYYVQALETETSLFLIAQMLKSIPDTILPILYTYDSILFDVEEGAIELLSPIVRMLENNAQFPIRIYVGKNYGEMTQIFV
jgi:hypothetical protein